MPSQKYQAVTLAKAEDHLVNIPPSPGLPKLDLPSIICEELEDSVAEPFPLKVQDKGSQVTGVPKLNLTGEGKKSPPTDQRLKPIPVPNTLPISPTEEVDSPTFGERENSSPSQDISSRNRSPKRPASSLKSSAAPVNVQHPLGQSALLRPLIARKEAGKVAEKSSGPQPRYPSEASTIKFNSSLSTPQKKAGKRLKRTEEVTRTDIGEGKFRLNEYIAGERLDSGELQGTWYRGTKAAESVVICEYRKRELQRVLVRKRETGLEALREQVEILSCADHPNLVPITEVLDSPDKDQMYIILGLDYACSLLSLAPLDEASAWDVYQQMMEAVKYLHEELRAVHSGLRPSSFVVDAMGGVKLCWVLALSPLSGANPGEDWFHLAAILFLLLFSKPEDGDDYFTELLQILRSERYLPHSIALPASCPPALCAFLTVALEKGDRLKAEDISSDPWVQSRVVNRTKDSVPYVFTAG